MAVWLTENRLLELVMPVCSGVYLHVYAVHFYMSVSASKSIGRPHCDVTIAPFQLAKVRDRLKGSPTLTARFDEVYGKLHVNSQVTTYTLDALLCHVPRDRRSNTLLLKKRTVSHRTLQPLSWSLLTE